MGIVIDWLLPAALAFMMLSLGISLTKADFLRVATRPRAFAVGALAQMLVLPLFAYGVALAFALPPELALGMVLLSLCPGGPTSNLFAKFAKGDVALSISLTGVITVISVFTVPFFAAQAGQYFLSDTGMEVSILPIAARALITMLIPILLGMWLRERAPDWVMRNEKRFSAVAAVLIALVILAALASQAKNVTTWIQVLGGACFTLMLLLLVAGLLLGKIFKLQRSETTSISIDTTMQNAVMGITLGSMFLTGSEPYALASVPSAIYGVMMYLVCIPFVFLRRRTNLDTSAVQAA
jgi:bile acid:Na+ symporter, BASS family